MSDENAEMTAAEVLALAERYDEQAQTTEYTSRMIGVTEGHRKRAIEGRAIAKALREYAARIAEPEDFGAIHGADGPCPCYGHSTKDDDEDFATTCLAFTLRVKSRGPRHLIRGLAFRLRKAAARMELDEARVERVAAAIQRACLNDREETPSWVEIARAAIAAMEAAAREDAPTSVPATCNICGQSPHAITCAKSCVEAMAMEVAALQAERDRLYAQRIKTIRAHMIPNKFGGLDELTEDEVHSRLLRSVELEAERDRLLAKIERVEALVSLDHLCPTATFLEVQP